MSHSRQTEHYELPLYDGSDIINPLTDFNNANSSIDEALYNANQRSVSAETTAQEAKGIAEGYDSRVAQAIQTSDDAMTLANNTQDMIADDFNPNKTGGYNVGDFVIYNGRLYRFINAHTGAWDASDVQVSPVLIEAIADVVDEGKQDIADAVEEAEQEIAGQTEKVTKTQAMIAQPFDENKTGGYAIGDIVTYADKLYKFTSAHSGAWTGLDVEQVDVVELMPSVIRIDLDYTLTFKTVITDIVSYLNSLGITDLSTIKDCLLKIVVKTEYPYNTTMVQTRFYRPNNPTDKDLTLSQIQVSLGSNQATFEMFNVRMATNSSQILATRGRIQVVDTTISYLNYADETDDIIMPESSTVTKSGYVEFMWQ